jgi:hypothetical protein
LFLAGARASQAVWFGGAQAARPLTAHVVQTAAVLRRGARAKKSGT